jgi:hypothetical protein
MRIEVWRKKWKDVDLKDNEALKEYRKMKSVY